MVNWETRPYYDFQPMYHTCCNTEPNKIDCPYCGYPCHHGNYRCPHCGLSIYEMMPDDLYCDKCMPSPEHVDSGLDCIPAEPTEPIPGNGQIYNPPSTLIKLEYGEYIQPWNGYVPKCTRKDQELCKYFPVQTSNIKTTVHEGIEVGSNKWMKLACDEAVKSVKCGGGPFAGIIVQIDDDTNEVIRYWIQHNHVPQEKDPTAHAELTVVRDACRSLGTVNLGRITREESRFPQKGTTSHCEIYSAAEPCPMCYSAIYWARIPVIYFAATRYDAAQQGVNFSDEPLYDDICKPYKNRRIKVYQSTTANSLDAFNLWKRSEKTQY